LIGIERAPNLLPHRKFKKLTIWRPVLRNSRKYCQADSLNYSLTRE